MEEKESERLKETIEVLARDKPETARLYELSNLHGEALQVLKQAWPTLPDERRE